MHRCPLLMLLLALLALPTFATPIYPWLAKPDPTQSLSHRINVPRGYERMPLAPGTFAEWLRNLPLKPGRPPVHLYNGQEKANDVHCAVVNIDTGNKDLQQCADAVMRLRAEYLYSRKEYAAITFNFTNGTPAQFSKWAQGYRPSVRGNNVRWVKAARPDSSYRSFRTYMDTVFSYAGSASLEKQMRSVPNANDMRIGDVFIHGGFPGHALIVVDMAVNRRTKAICFLLAQSYMPAQDIHLLRNFNHGHIDPWYPLSFGTTLYTPEWTFKRGELRRF